MLRVIQWSLHLHQSYQCEADARDESDNDDWEIAAEQHFSKGSFPIVVYTT